MNTLVVFFGMIASGKSTLGQAWSEHCHAPYYNTDRVRKELLGLRPTDRRSAEVGQGIYSSEWTEKTYTAMLDRARVDFANGKEMVVLDGSYGRRHDREQVRQLAAEMGARCVLVWCVCSDTEVERRLVQRARDRAAVSDGRWEIYLHQKKVFERPDSVQETDCLVVNTESEVAQLLLTLARAFRH